MQTLKSRKLSPTDLLSSSLAVVYIWFGLLKLLGISPAVDLVRRAHELLASEPMYVLLGVAEVGIGVLLLGGRWRRYAAAAAAAHLGGTFILVITSPSTLFLPTFPFLTLEGEFVLKNLVLIAAAVAVWMLSASAGAPRLQPLSTVAFVLLMIGAGVVGHHFHRTVRHAALHPAITGDAPRRIPTSEVARLVAADSAPWFTLEGDLVRRCPLLGCWIELEDEAGKVAIDLAPSGLSARSFQLGERLKVTGSIGKTRDGGVGFVASAVQATGGGPM